MMKDMFGRALKDLGNRLPANITPSYRADLCFVAPDVIYFYLYDDTTKTYLDDNMEKEKYMFRAKLKHGIEFIDTVDVSEFVKLLNDILESLDMQTYGRIEDNTAR